MGYLIYKTAATLTAIIPRKLALALATLAGWMLFAVKRRDRRGLISNIRQITSHSGRQLSDREVRRIARRVFPNFCKNLVDFFSMHRLGDEQILALAEFPDAPLVAQLLREGKGVILLTAHLGSWEIAGRLFTALGHTLNAVALRQPSKKLNELFQGQRKGGGVNVILMGNAARGCLAALRRKQLVAIVCDRDFTAQRNLVTFFGKPARLPAGAARLSVATGAPLLMGVCVRTADDRFRVILSEPIHPQQGDGEEQRLQREIAARLESFVARFPDQWFLFHDFWDIEKDLDITHGAFKRAAANASQRNTVTA
jgi:KDO2-lipid IV(A) lauroyltransferase